MCNNSFKTSRGEDSKAKEGDSKGQEKGDKTMGKPSELKGSLFNQEKKAHGIDNRVGPFLRKGSLVALVAWLLGNALIFTYSPPESYEYLEGAERTSNMLVLATLVYSNVSRFLHLIIRDKTLTFANTGVIFGAAMVQILAMLSICMMLFLPTPVLIDPVTGLRCHLVRWVEWIVLAFLMTFLTESMDIPLDKKKDTSIAWIHGIAIGVSTSGGILFPLCRTWASWLTVLATSWTLFCSLFIRLHQRYRRLQSMSADGSVDQKEDYNRAKYSLKTIAVCTIVWTLLAASFTFIAVVRSFVPEDSFLATDSLVLVTESLFETISKVWYFSLLLEVHYIVFDDASRIMRRLEELRQFMSTIWNTSSDVMIWYSAVDGNIHAVINPAFFDLCKPPTEDQRIAVLKESTKRPTLVLEINQNTGTSTYRILRLDMSAAVTREDAMDMMFNADEVSENADVATDRLTDENIGVVAKLLIETFSSNQNEMVLMTELQSSDADGAETTVRCEAKVSKLASSCLVTLRDISERFHRFETEKKLVEEMTARRKDAEANRFTRHEVKNSILAAIGVLESIRSTATTKSQLPSTLVFERKDSEISISASAQGSDSVAGSSHDNEYTTFDDHAGELDNTLRTVLDTIMDHAMSREVMNEEYEPRKERVLVPDVLSTIIRQSNSSGARFAMNVYPRQFPLIGLDPRLLRYIYQNALSNASRYGKRGGPVETSVFYDSDAKEFRMEVTNLPGIGHQELVTMDHDEIQDKVFSPGSRLHKKSLDEHEMSVTNSSGDGAWIMGKCVKIMKGKCELRFEPDRTIFSFTCPAKAHNSKDRAEPELTSLPDNTWGVVIDDSGIQRKLMDRYLKIAGIDKDRRVIVGKDSNEIYGFNDMVVDLVQKNPESKFLIIADENLDVLEGVALHGTVSGSSCLEKILERLDEEDEARVLALVRSANDSAKEADLYKKRAHGYLVKAPIDKNGVLSAIQPWWSKRFPKGNSNGRSLSPSNSVSSLDTEDYDPYADIKANVEILNALCVASGDSLRNRWRTIKDRLQALKGDLKSTVSREGLDLRLLVDSIDTLRAGKVPEDLQSRWTSLRDQIDKVLDSSQ